MIFTGREICERKELKMLRKKGITRDGREYPVQEG